jgi:hypothetical protein
MIRYLISNPIITYSLLHFTFGPKEKGGKRPFLHSTFLSPRLGNERRVSVTRPLGGCQHARIRAMPQYDPPLTREQAPGDRRFILLRAAHCLRGKSQVILDFFTK